MCLILFSWKQQPGYKLIVAANRDEFYARPTAPADYWRDATDLLGGRDLEAGGTWLGLTRSGRFAAITNYRDPSIKKEDAPSRGALTTDFLQGSTTPAEYISRIDEVADLYYGYNLLVSDSDEMWYYSNVTKEAKSLGPGTYGLSNALLDTSWPKVELGKTLFKQTLEHQGTNGELLDILRNSAKPDDNELPQTGVPYEWEKAISSMFIETETYGTCCSTIVTLDHANKATFIEKSYPVGDRNADTKSYEFKIG